MPTEHQEYTAAVVRQAFRSRDHGCWLEQRRELPPCLPLYPIFVCFPVSVPSLASVLGPAPAPLLQIMLFSAQHSL